MAILGSVHLGRQKKQRNTYPIAHHKIKEKKLYKSVAKMVRKKDGLLMNRDKTKGVTGGVHQWEVGPDAASNTVVQVDPGSVPGDLTRRWGNREIGKGLIFILGSLNVSGKDYRKGDLSDRAWQSACR